MSKEKCKHKEWNPCGNNFYSCRQCGILRTSQQVNIYAEKDKQISELEKQLADAEHEIENYKHELEVYKHNDNIYSNSIIKLNNNAKRNKIDFAVEWLEKVRKTIKTLHGQKNCKIGNSYIQKKDKLYNKYIIELDILEEVLKIFDNQINQLKEK